MSRSIIIDVESDGPAPTLGSMVCFGVVIVDQPNKTFYGRTKPIVDVYNPEALAISGFSREQHLTFEDPEETMLGFEQWLKDNINGRPIMWSDNPSFDFMWMAYYTHRYLGHNPLGYSARRIGDLYCGAVGDLGKNNEWKRKHRGRIPHDHHPIHDSLGNVNALLEIKEKYGIKGNF